MTKTAASGSFQETRQPYRTLRDWLDRLAATGRLAVARPGIKLEYELAAVTNLLEQEQAVLFPSPSGHATPVVCSLLIERSWIADALGVKPDELLEELQRCVRSPIAPTIVETAPVQQVVHTEVDLLKLLPAPTLNALDDGPYISAGLFITANPATGAQNVSICRAHVGSAAKLNVAVGSRDTLSFFLAAEEAGVPLPVAIVIGNDPLTLLASQVTAPTDQNELEIAGAMHGQPLPVVRCRTSELLVPADSEIVIEGRFLPRVREPEGPFGEFTQTYGHRGDQLVMEVDCVTHRKDPIFHAIVGGSREHLLLGAVPREAHFLAMLRNTFPQVQRVRLSDGGCARYHLFVQTRKRHESEARNIILAAMSVHTDVKLVVVVDEDVDIDTPQQVEWAVATRFQPDRDLIVVPNCMSAPLDPSSRTSGGTGAKWGLDATKPLTAAPVDYARISVLGADAVKLDEVIGAISPTDWRSALIQEG